MQKRAAPEPASSGDDPYHSLIAASWNGQIDVQRCRADKIIVAFLRIKLDRESARIVLLQ